MSKIRRDQLLNNDSFNRGDHFSTSDALRMMSNRTGPKITVSMTNDVLIKAFNDGLVDRLERDGKVRWCKARPFLTCIPWKPTRHIDESCQPRYY